MNLKIPIFFLCSLSNQINLGHTGKRKKKKNRTKEEEQEQKPEMLIYEWPNNRKNVLLFLICMAKEKQEVLSKKPNKKLD